MVTSLTPGGLPKVTSSHTKRLPFSGATPPQQPARSAEQNTVPSLPSVSNPSTQATQSTAPTFRASATASVNLPPAPQSTFTLSQDMRMIRSGTERALNQLEERYKAMFDGIQLKYFDPTKIEQYIKMAEKRSGIEMSEKERIRLIQISRINNPTILKYLALELRIGIPKRLEQAALAALGELMLYREDEAALQGYLDDPTKDDNLKAYVRTVLMMNKVERVMAKVESAKTTVKSWIGGVFDQSGDQQQQKKKRQKRQQAKKTMPSVTSR